jgi:hypothetical protein
LCVCVLVRVLAAVPLLLFPVVDGPLEVHVTLPPWLWVETPPIVPAVLDPTSNLPKKDAPLTVEVVIWLQLVGNAVLSKKAMRPLGMGPAEESCPKTIVAKGGLLLSAVRAEPAAIVCVCVEPTVVKPLPGSAKTSTDAGEVTAAVVVCVCVVAPPVEVVFSPPRR